MSDKITLKMKNLINENREKIEKSSPLNPSISKDDEWLLDDHWDKEERRLDFTKIKIVQSNKTTKEALTDVIPIKWSDDVLNGKRKAIISKEIND